MQHDGEYLDVNVRLRIADRGWQAMRHLADAGDLKFTRSDDASVWSGRLEVSSGRFCRIEQTLREDGEAATLDLKVTAEHDLDVEGVFLFVSVPISVFAGGSCELFADGTAVASAVMPATKPQQPHFLQGTGTSVRLSDAAGKTSLLMS